MGSGGFWRPPELPGPPRWAPMGAHGSASTHTEWCLKEPLPACSQPAPCRSQESGCREGLQSPPQAGLCPPGCCHPAHLLPRNRRLYSWWSPGCGKWPDEPARHPGLWVHRSPQGPVKAPPPPAIGSRGSQWLPAPQRHVLAACLQPPGEGGGGHHNRAHLRDGGRATQTPSTTSWPELEPPGTQHRLETPCPPHFRACGGGYHPTLRALWGPSPWHPSTQRLT